MKTTEIQYLEINRSAFDYLNDEDAWGVFVEAREKKYSSLSFAEQGNFDHELFTKEETDKLYKSYDKLVVGSDDTLYGSIGSEKKVLKNAEGLFEAAESALKL
jgi:hypothetical protein